MVLMQYSLEGLGLFRAMLGLGCMELDESCRVAGVGEVAEAMAGVVREEVRDCLGEMFSLTPERRGRETYHI